jgi:hypothetical protein
VSPVLLAKTVGIKWDKPHILVTLQNHRIATWI